MQLTNRRRWDLIRGAVTVPAQRSIANGSTADHPSAIQPQASCLTLLLLLVLIPKSTPHALQATSRCKRTRDLLADVWQQLLHQRVRDSGDVGATPLGADAVHEADGLETAVGNNGNAHIPGGSEGLCEIHSNTSNGRQPPMTGSALNSDSSGSSK